MASLFSEYRLTPANLMETLLTSGFWAGFVAVFGSEIFGKRLSDYEGEDLYGNDLSQKYRVHELPDAKYKVVVSIETGKVEGVFDNTLLPTNSVEVLNELSLAVSNSALFAIGGLQGSLLRLALDSFFAEMRRGFTESNPGWWNGDVNPLIGGKGDGFIFAEI